MKHIVVIFLLALAAIPAAANAFPGETDASYYGRQAASCIHAAPRESFWDFLSATRRQIKDDCCAESVDAMRAAHASRLAPGESCPPGMHEKSLDCPTSKHWCVK